MEKYNGFEDLKRYEEKADSKGRIVNSAIYCFAKDGYMSTKTKDIAALAGVSEALVFKYFGNKQKLLGEVCMIIIEERIPALFRYRLDEIFGSEPAFTEALTADVVTGKFLQLENNIGYFKVLFHEIDYNAKPIIDEIRHMASAFWTYIEKGLVQLQQLGVFRSDLDTRVMVRSLSGMLFMLMMDRNFLGNRRPIEEEIQGILSLYMKGVGHHESR